MYHGQVFGKIKGWIWRAKNHILMLFATEYKRSKIRCFYSPFEAPFDRYADKSLKNAEARRKIILIPKNREKYCNVL